MSRYQTFAMILVAVLSTIVVLRVAFDVGTGVLGGMLAVGIVTAFIEARPDR